MVPPIVAKLKDRANFPIKLANERTLIHLLAIHSDPSVLKDYLATLEPTSAKWLQDYATKILVKLSATSDDETSNDNSSSGKTTME